MSISGKFINVTGTAITIAGVNHARARITADELDKSSGASAGYGDRDPGLLDIELTFGGWIDVGGGNYPGGIVTGSTVANLSIPVNSNGSIFLANIPSGLVLSYQAGGETRGRLEFEATVKNKGTFNLGTV